MSIATRITTLGLRGGLGAALVLGSIVGPSCNGGEGDGGGRCTPGEQQVCPCGGPVDGIQVCLEDGSAFGPCACDDGTGDGTTGDPAPTTGGSSGADTTGPPEPSTGDSAGDDTTGAPECTDQGPIYVTTTAPVASRWESGALVGFAAGQALCREAAGAMGLPGAGEVTVCTYLQLIQAELRGELAAVPAGTTAWLHRTTVADVMGTPSEAGIGGRCVDWTSLSNELADGEHVNFPGGGVIEYVLDDDTTYDGVDTSHTQVGLLECGMQMRSIPCCNPTCTP